MSRFGLLTAALLLTSALQADASTFRVLHEFTDSPDGRWPNAAPIEDSLGNLYGTTTFGGSTGAGTVYKITPAGVVSTFYEFKEFTEDGNFPVADLVMDGDGNLYGSTQFGGGTGCSNQGCGTVFKITPDGTETVLHSFPDNGVDGILPDTALVLDDAGNLYGGALQGGAHSRGTIFKIAPDGTETVIHAFKDEVGGDIGNPNSLAMDRHGNLYGTTASWSGASPCSIYCGEVFKITPDGTETLLHVFTEGDDGALPHGRVVIDAHGNLFGTASIGGAHGFGTVFEIASSGTFSTLYAFAGGSDGNGPSGDLAMDKNGNLYGTTQNGGEPCFHGWGCGTVFKVTPAGSESILYAIKRKQGYFPVSGLMKDKRGIFYGTAQYAYPSTKYGSVFKIRP